MEVDCCVELPTPPFYNHSINLSNKMVEAERNGKIMISKYQKYVLIYSELLILFTTIFLSYALYYEMNWFKTHEILFIISLPIILNSCLRLLFPIKTSYYNGGFIPQCSEEEKEMAIKRAELARQYNKKLIETNYNARYCIVCEHFLPPRAYHCAICNKCTLERDHHCSWLGFCVGKYNLRSFWQFLVSLCGIGLVGSYHFGLFWYEILFVSNIWKPFSFKILLFYYFMIMMTCISMSIAGLMVVMLFIHTRDILYGLSGVEIGELNSRERMRETVKQPTIQFTNFKKALGPNILYWFLPIPMN